MTTALHIIAALIGIFVVLYLVAIVHALRENKASAGPPSKAVRGQHTTGLNWWQGTDWKGWGYSSAAKKFHYWNYHAHTDGVSGTWKAACGNETRMNQPSPVAPELRPRCAKCQDLHPLPTAHE